MSQRLPLFQLLSGLLLLLALVLRLGGLSAPPTDFHHVAQSKSVSIAKNMADLGFDLTAPRVDWRGAHPGLATSGIPLYELAVGAGWTGVDQLESSDYLWARGLSLMGWTLGALALLAWVRRRLRGPPVLYLLLYLFAPLGVVMSRNIQPDSIALGIFLASLLLLDLRRDAASRARSTGLFLSGGLALGLSLAMDATLVGGLAAPLWLAWKAPSTGDSSSGTGGVPGVARLVVLALLAFLPLALWVTHLQDQGRPNVLGLLVGWTASAGALWGMILELSSWRPMVGTGLVALLTPLGVVAILALFLRRDALEELTPFVLGLFGFALWFLPWGLLFGSRTFEFYPVLPFVSVAVGSGLLASWERAYELPRLPRLLASAGLLSLLVVSIILGLNFSSKAHQRDSRVELWGSLLPTLVEEDRPMVVSDVAPETILVISDRRGWAGQRLSMSAIARFEQAGARYLLLTSESPMWMNRGFRMQLAETRPEVARAEKFVVYGLRGQSTVGPGVSGVPMP